MARTHNPESHMLHWPSQPGAPIAFVFYSGFEKLTNWNMKRARLEQAWYECDNCYCYCYYFMPWFENNVLFSVI